MSDATTFETAKSLNVSGMVEKKGGLSYLSWANAWGEFKKLYPDATYEVAKDENGKCWFGDSEQGYMVYTSVTAGGTTHTMWLPVLDFYNKALMNPTTFDINKAVMRCLTKNFAMFGLGLYIYAGEDLPEQAPKTKSEAVKDMKKQGYKVKQAQPAAVTSEVINKEKIAVLDELTGDAQTAKLVAEVLKRQGKSDVSELTNSEYDQLTTLIAQLRNKQRKAAKNG